MKVKHVEKLPAFFEGVGKYCNREYHTLKRKGVIGLFEIHDEYGKFRYEVAVIDFFISCETENRVERYPSDNKLNYLFWKFEDKTSAENFFTRLLK